MRHIIIATALALCTAAWAPSAAAQAYPDKPVKLVIPFTPGGSNDVLARLIAQDLSAAWGQAVVAENKPGAAGNIGAEFVVHSPPDGYTLLIAANNVLSVNPALYRQNFDPARDLAPVTLLGTVPIVLVVNASLPIRTVEELVDHAKARPGALNYASSGAGSPQHLSAELFKSIVGVDMTHIPYKGAAPATADLLAGQVQVLFAPLNSVLPHIRSGKLRALAMAGRQRTALLPDVGTVAEAGYPDYDSDIWIALVAPAGTPASVVRRIGEDVRTVLDSPAARKTLSDQGIEAKASSPEALRTLAARDLDRWSRVIRNAGISLEAR